MLVPVSARMTEDEVYSTELGQTLFGVQITQQNNAAVKDALWCYFRMRENQRSGVEPDPKSN